MWVNAKQALDQIADRLRKVEDDYREQRCANHELRGENQTLRVMNTRLQSDLDWFKHRVTQLEKERGQLILDRLGLAMPVPQFEPSTANPAEAFNNMPNLDSVGNDAIDQPEEEDNSPAAMLGRELAVSYDMMPRRN